MEQAQEQFEIDQARRLAAMAGEVERNKAGWLAADAALRNRPTIRVQTACNQGGLSAPTATGLKFDATSSKSGVGSSGAASNEVSVSQAEQRIDNGIRDAARILWLQDYIESIHEKYK